MIEGFIVLGVFVIALAVLKIAVDRYWASIGFRGYAEHLREWLDRRSGG